MKKINVRFEQDKTLDGIEILIRAGERDAQINKMIESLEKSSAVKLTALDKDNCQCVIDENEIFFISADGKSIRIITAHGKYRAKQSLQSIEELLSEKFLRVSRFEIINLDMVRKYDFTLGGTLRIELENGMETWASRRYIPLIKERLSREEGYLC